MKNEVYDFEWADEDLDALRMHCGIVCYFRLASGGHEPQLRIVAHVHDGHVFVINGTGVGMKFTSVPLSQCDPGSLLSREKMAEITRGVTAGSAA